MMKKIILSFVAIITVFSFSFTAQPALAQDGESWLDGITPNGTFIPVGCRSKEADPKIEASEETRCSVNEIMQIIINVTQLIMAMTGSAALLMFTYGGVMFIISSGNQERVSKAKEILKAAVIGMAVVFLAWLIVNITILTLTGGDIASTATIFGNPWNSPPGE